MPQNLEALERLHACIGGVPLLVGYVDRNEGRGKPFFNAAALLERGQPIRKSFKTLLPTYDVFDEDRYFEPGSGGEIFTIAGRQVGVTICEDIWTEDYLPRPLYDLELVTGLVAKGAEIIVNLSASPFSVRKLGDPPRDGRDARARASAPDRLLQRRRRQRRAGLRWQLDRVQPRRRIDRAAPFFPNRGSHRRDGFDRSTPPSAGRSDGRALRRACR